MAESTDELEVLSEEELLASPLIEVATTPALIVPKKGKLFEEDGTCRISVIRPCVSRGKRLRGLPPIYTPAMLAENASVFSGWLMYMDHLTEAVAETLKKRGRSITELGGRVIESYYDPDLTFKDDADYGYQRGGVAARVLPQPAVRAMLEADPEILQASINAYPKGAKAGVAPWDAATKGMIVEGIRKVPQGSVDWVPRGGAGGRVLQEWDEATVSILESFYDSTDKTESEMPNLKEHTFESLLEAAKTENPELAAKLQEQVRPEPKRETIVLPEGVLTEEQLSEKLEEQREEFNAQLAEKDAEVDSKVSEALQEARVATTHEDKARQLIKAAGLPSRWQQDLLRRYSVLPSGPSPALLTEALDDKSAEQVLVESVNADIDHAWELIQEAGGRPRVTGLGGRTTQEGANKRRPRNSAFRDFLKESGDLKPKEGEKLTEEVEHSLIKNFVLQEGI